MTDDGKILFIPKIEHGIVIDHIPAKSGLRILGIIHRYPEMTDTHVTVGLNYPSNKLGRKDLIKLGIDELPARVLEHIAVVCPGVTVKRIKNYQVEAKLVLDVPDLLVDQARCRNPGCITNHERDVTTRFRCVDRSAKQFRCTFCERTFPLSELRFSHAPLSPTLS